MVCLLIEDIYGSRSNNIQQMGLAFHDYASANGGFPPAIIFSGSCEYSNGGQGLLLNTTAFTMILAFIDQIPLYNAYNFSQTSANSTNTVSAAGSVGPANTILMGSQVVNTTVVGAMVASYVCPSDTYPSAIHPTVATGTNGLYSNMNARESNYLVSTANYTDYTCPGGNGVGNPNPSLQGAFYTDISLSIAKFQDGTSNTSLDGESLQSPGQDSTYYGPFWGAGSHTSTHGVIYPPLEYGGPNLYALLTAPNAGFDVFYTIKYGSYHSSQPNDFYPYAYVFSSRHPGGLNMGWPTVAPASSGIRSILVPGFRWRPSRTVRSSAPIPTDKETRP